jgi:cytochrome b
MEAMSSAPQQTDDSVPMRIWDIPVRVVHWAVVPLVGFSWASGKNDWWLWHRLSGYAILCLIIFRIAWGFCGSKTARFAHFLHGPKVIYQYVRMLFSLNRHYPSLGHNPLGGWNVLALLLALLTQTLSGLITVDVDGLESGPLAKYVSFTIGRLAAGLHDKSFNALLLLIGLHIAAILVHLLLYRENLITPMLTGIKRLPRVMLQDLQPGTPWLVLAAVAASVMLVLIVALGS